MEAVTAAILAALEEGRAGAVATITRARGSTYRREGARMWIPAAGEPVGSLSGGCLEGDVLAVAAEVIATGRPRRVGYDMTADDDALWGLGLGCNGAVDVLIEPLQSGHGQVLRWREQGHRLAVVVPLPPLEPRDPAGAEPAAGAAGDPDASGAVAGCGTAWPGEGDGVPREAGDGAAPGALPPGTAGDGATGAGATGARGTGRPAGGGAGRSVPRRQLVVWADGSSEGSLGSPELDAHCAAAARQWLAAGRTGTLAVPGGGEFFIEVVLPPPVLLVCGAGHDAVPVVETAAPLGYDVVVADSRPSFARPDRFPRARRVVRTHPEDLRRHVTLDDRTFVVIMTHNFLQDAGFLEAVLDSPVRYIGLLGPRHRAERLLEELRRRGIEPAEEQLARIHAPVGLDTGGETPEEIACSLLAEVQAVRYGRKGGFLRDRPGPIHPRAEEERARG
ncbi:XdhC family protein [Thermaerobacter sp. PB12/4term]|uniref:XdhC family protein n=1 Tax=Thermaerobacter sp. PB12/4term TaxID=2293838 RepID=UPI000E325AF0|nr:XdhC/CoxI family protein [Thermaerobacter sp. PB12/4term]QIA27422.1 XdhC family protein [Thermaerobacter sp. PB12/4term]